MKKRGTYEKREPLSVYWVVLGAIAIILWVILFLAPIWAPAFGLK